MKRYLQLLIGILVSVFFIYLTLPGLHLPDVWQAVRAAAFGWIVPGIAVYFVALWVRTWRWHYTLRHLQPISLPNLFPLICIGYFGNNVYPFRAGEIMRSYLLKRRYNIPISSSFATVFIERVFDGLVMLLFVFVVLPFAPMPAQFRNLVIVLTIAMLAATTAFIWIAMQPQRFSRVYQWVAGRIIPDRLRVYTDELYSRFLEGLRSLSSSADILMIFFTSIIIWLLETVKYWFVMHAFAFQVSFLVLMLMNGLVNLATTLPSAPGYIGTFDTPGIETLAAFGIERDLAASYTFTLHAALWIPVTVVGAYFFWRQHLHWEDFTEAQHQIDEPLATAGD